MRFELKLTEIKINVADKEYCALTVSMHEDGFLACSNLLTFNNHNDFGELTLKS